MLKDEANKSIDLLIMVIGGFLAAFFGMIAYLFVNIDDLSATKIGILIVGIVVAGIFLLGFTYIAIKKLRELRYLK